MRNYKVIRTVGEIGFNKSLKVVRWYENDQKYDLRIWGSNGAPKKGITFSREELVQLKDIIEDIIYK